MKRQSNEVDGGEVNIRFVSPIVQTGVTVNGKLVAEN